jgi:hypothetical protein
MIATAHRLLTTPITFGTVAWSKKVRILVLTLGVFASLC